MFKRRYDVAAVKMVSDDMEVLKKEGHLSLIMDFFYSNVENGYVPEQFYPSEARPHIHLALHANALFF